MCNISFTRACSTLEYAGSTRFPICSGKERVCCVVDIGLGCSDIMYKRWIWNVGDEQGGYSSCEERGRGGIVETITRAWCRRESVITERRCLVLSRPQGIQWQDSGASTKEEPKSKRRTRQIDSVKRQIPAWRGNDVAQPLPLSSLDSLSSFYFLNFIWPHACYQ